MYPAEAWHPDSLRPSGKTHIRPVKGVLCTHSSCIVQMIASGFLVLVITFYLLFGVMLAGEHLLMLGGAFTMFSLIVVLLLSCAEFGFALYAFTDIRRAEPLGIR